MSTKEASVTTNSAATIQTNAEKTLIVLSAPSVKNKYYTSTFTSITEYMINFAKIVNGKDEVAILADAATIPYLKGKVPSNTLIKANIEDMWIRDFAPVIPSKQSKFKYLPYYEYRLNSAAIENSFKHWFSENGLQYYKTSNILLDGGNVVDNAAGTRAIITDRVLFDNPSLTESDAKDSLKLILGANEVAIIDELSKDTTGHADGMAMWATDDRILILKRAEPKRTKVLNELKSSFPGVEIIELPDYVTYERWRGFNTAYNDYVNCIVTDNYIYMPTFDNPHDTEMLTMIQSYTNKMVVPVPAQNVCNLGGSVRCLSWQVKGENKAKLLKLARQ